VIGRAAVLRIAGPVPGAGPCTGHRTPSVRPAGMPAYVREAARGGPEEDRCAVRERTVVRGPGSPPAACGCRSYATTR